MGIVARDSSDLGVDSLAIGARGGAGMAALVADVVTGYASLETVGFLRVQTA